MTELLYIISFLFFGLLVGFLTGAMGIGGGVVMVPVFMIFFDIIGLPKSESHYLAIGSSLFAAILASISGTIRHIKNKNVEFKLGILFAIFAVISASILSNVALQTSVNTLKIVFVVVLIFVVIRLFMKDKAEEQKELEFNYLNIILIPLIGAIIGMLSAFTGIGGGILAVPVFYYFFHLSFKKAIGTSSFVIIFSVISALIFYLLASTNKNLGSPYIVGFVHLLVALPTGVGAIISAQYGANYANTAKTKKLKLIFAGLIILTIVKIFWDLVK